MRCENDVVAESCVKSLSRDEKFKIPLFTATAVIAVLISISNTNSSPKKRSSYPNITGSILEQLELE